MASLSLKWPGAKIRYPSMYRLPSLCSSPSSAPAPSIARMPAVNRHRESTSKRAAESPSFRSSSLTLVLFLFADLIHLTLKGGAPKNCLPFSRPPVLFRCHGTPSRSRSFRARSC